MGNRKQTRVFGGDSMIVLSNGESHYFQQPFNADINTIAHALAHINRFTGHVGQYSVAQHCVLVAAQLPKELKLAGLLHDAPEAYIGDVSAPLKRLLPEYKRIEKWYHQQIDQQFNVETEHPAVKEVDIQLLVTEAISFGLPVDDFPQVQPLELTIEPWNPALAQVMFMDTYLALTKQE